MRVCVCVCVCVFVLPHALVCMCMCGFLNFCLNLHGEVLLKALVYMILCFNYNVINVVSVTMFLILLHSQLDLWGSPFLVRFLRL